MILTLDVGNTQIYGGLFVKGKLKFTFRKNTHSGNSSDELGLFLKNILRENEIDPDEVKQISLCTVVPEYLYSVTSACIKYFDKEPFVLAPGVKTGFKISYKNPLEVGADRIANIVGAVGLYPGENLCILDFGTATTVCAVTKSKIYLGGVILPGLRISMEALEERTSKLPAVEIVRPKQIIGRSTVESIQSGLFHLNYFGVKGMIAQIRKDYFKGENLRVLGTGGFARLFEGRDLYDHFTPDLVLQGLYRAYEMNQSKDKE